MGNLIPLLAKVVKEEVSSDARAYAATLLLHFGSPAGVPCLLELLSRGEGPILHIVLSLGKARIVEAKATISEILCHWDEKSDPYGAATIVHALKQVGGELPESFRARVAAQCSEPLRAALLKSDGDTPVPE